MFVALDIAMCMADDGMEINVLNIVSSMRDERSVMVPNVVNTLIKIQTEATSESVDVASTKEYTYLNMSQC